MTHLTDAQVREIDHDAPCPDSQLPKPFQQLAGSSESVIGQGVFKRMSHHDRHIRRRLMAKLIADGHRCSAVARRFGLTRFTAIAAAREFGVNIGDRRRTLNMPAKGAA